MALDVCDKMVKADLARAAGDTATLWRFAPAGGNASADQINENARYLALRFLGLKLGAADPMIASLVELQGAGKASADAMVTGTEKDAAGWRAVCIALFQDPAFHVE
jgi:hypothetical protein